MISHYLMLSILTVMLGVVLFEPVSQAVYAAVDHQLSAMESQANALRN
jgi:hypothetical protein